MVVLDNLTYDYVAPRIGIIELSLKQCVLSTSDTSEGFTFEEDDE